MTLDTLNIDTPTRVVINDLDAELAEIEAEEERSRQNDQEQAFFLPDDVEKEINSVPQHVLRNGNTTTADPPPSQALILYKNPTSISMREEEDAVRKAVREARARLRDKHKDEPATRQQRAQLPKFAPPWPGFEPIMDDDDFEQQRQYQETAGDWNDHDDHDDDAMEIE